MLGVPICVPYSHTCLSESAVWEPAEEIQKQQWVAEAVGGVHKLLPVLLQVTPGTCVMEGRWPCDPSDEASSVQVGESLRDPQNSTLLSHGAGMERKKPGVERGMQGRTISMRPSTIK